MTKSKKIICPDCGVEMNRHAEKMNYTTALAEPGATDLDLGGVIEDAHTCPACGQTLMRRERETVAQE